MTEEAHHPIGAKSWIRIKRASYLKVIPASIAILFTISYKPWVGFEPAIENVLTVSKFLFLLLILFMLVRIDTTIPNIIMATTLVTPLTMLFRLLLFRFLFFLAGGVSFFSMIDFLGFLTVFSPLLAISLALIDKLMFHKLGYRETIIPILISSLALMIASGTGPLELNSIPNLVGLWVIPLLYVIIGPTVIRWISRQDFDTEKVEDVFLVTFSLGSYPTSFFVAQVFAEPSFLSWGSLDGVLSWGSFIPIEILFASLLFPWSLYWAVSEGFKTKRLKSIISLLLFYGFSFLLVSLSYIMPLETYPYWVIQTGVEFPSLFSILLYLLYAIVLPVIVIRRYKSARYLYAAIVFVLPIIAKTVILNLFGSSIEASTGDALIAITSVISVSVAFEFVRKMFKEKDKT